MDYLEKIYSKDFEMGIFIKLIRSILNPNSGLRDNIYKEINYLEEKSILKILDFIKIENLTLFIINGLHKEKINKTFYKFLYKQALIDNYKCFITFSFIKEISIILKKENLKYLFLKGNTLALQTTNKLNLRGPSKDIDILVNKNDINKCIEILSKNRYLLNPSSEVFIKNGLVGKYSRFLEPELIIYKRFLKEKIYIDMHWRTSWINSLSLKFNDLYEKKQYVEFNTYKFPTLSIEDAFLNTCNHAAINEWNNIREFIDIDYLSRICTTKNNELPFIDNEIVRKSINYTYQFTKSNHLSKYINKNSFKKAYYFYSKQIKNHSSKNYKKLLGIKIKRTIKFLKLSSTFRDYLSTLFLFILPPKNLIDINSGNVKKINIVIKERLILMFKTIQSLICFNSEIK